jgi:hypothetical protein
MQDGSGGKKAAMKLSTRELVMLTVTLFVAVFYFFWQFMFSPLLKDIESTRTNIGSVQLQIRSLHAATAVEDKAAQREAIQISPKEEQVERIMRFLDYKFRWYGIELISLSQYTERDKIAFDLKIKSSTFQLLGFLRSLEQIKTMLVVDTADIIQDPQEEKLSTGIKLISKYQY